MRNTIHGTVCDKLNFVDKYGDLAAMMTMTKGHLFKEIYYNTIIHLLVPRILNATYKLLII